MDLLSATFGKLLENAASFGAPVTLSQDLLGLKVSAGAQILGRITQGVGGQSLWGLDGAQLAHVRMDAAGVMHAEAPFGQEMFQAVSHANGSVTFGDPLGAHLGGAYTGADGVGHLHDAMQVPYAELHAAGDVDGGFVFGHSGDADFGGHFGGADGVGHFDQPMEISHQAVPAGSDAFGWVDPAHEALHEQAAGFGAMDLYAGDFGFADAVGGGGADFLHAGLSELDLADFGDLHDFVDAIDPSIFDEF